MTEQYGFLSDFLIEYNAVIMGGTVLFALQNRRADDIDIGLRRKHASRFIDKYRFSRSLLIIGRYSREAVLYYRNRCLHLHYEKGPDRFFELRRSLFWDGKKIFSLMPIEDALRAIEDNEVVITKKYNEVVDSPIMIRVKRESMERGTSMYRTNPKYNKSHAEVLL